MFHLMTSLFVAALFYVLTPGIFLRLPPNGSKMMVAAVHAVVFAVVFGLTQKAVWAYFKYEGFYGDEGFYDEDEEGFKSGPPPPPPPSPKQAAYMRGVQRAAAIAKR
jgi:hypothetical protein